MYTDEEGSTHTVANVVRNLLVSQNAQKISELEAQLTQLRLLHAVQEKVVGTINAYYQTRATQLPSFAADVQAKAEAAVLQLGTQVSEAEVAFADHNMQDLAQMQAQFHDSSEQMQHLMV